MSQVPYPQQPQFAGQFAPQQYAPQQPQFAPQQYAPTAPATGLPAIPTFEVQNEALFSSTHSPVADANLRGGLHTRIATSGVDVEFPQKNSMIVRLLPGICLGGGKLLSYRSPEGTFDGIYNGRPDCWFRKYPLWRGGHNRAIAMLCPDMAENNRESPISLLINAAFQSQRGSADPAWQHLLKGAQGRGADLGSADNYALVRALVYQRNPATGEASQYDPPRGVERPTLLVIRAGTFEDFETWAAANPQVDPIALDAGVFWSISYGSAGGAVQMVSGGHHGQGRGAAKPGSERYRMQVTGLTHAVTQQPVSPALTMRGDAFVSDLCKIMLPWDRLLAPPSVEEQVIELVQAFPTDLCLYAWSGHPEWLALPEVQQRKAQPLLMKQTAAPVQVQTTQPAPGGFNPYAPGFAAGFAPGAPGFAIPAPGAPGFAMPAPGAPGYPAGFVAPPPGVQPQQPPQFAPGAPQQPQATQPAFLAPPPGVQYAPPQQQPQQFAPQQPQAPQPAFLAPPPGVQYAPQQPQYAPQQPQYAPPQQPQYAPPQPAPQQPTGPLGAQHDAGVTALFTPAPQQPQPQLQPAAAALSAYMPQG